jgi:hypothetical protein
MRDLACVSDLVLDRLWAGELASDESVALHAHAARCERCGARLTEYEAFLKQAPSFAAHAAQLGRPHEGPADAPAAARLGTPVAPFEAAAAASTASAAATAVRSIPRRPSRLRTALVVGGGLLSCAAALMLLVRPLSPGPHERSKGAPHIGYFIKRDGRVSFGRPGQRLREGDLLRFTVSSDRARYLALIDHDPQGARVYYPAGSHAVKVGIGNAVALDFSVELDDSLGPERIYAVFCAETFALEPLRAELARHGELSPPPGCTLDVTEIRKGAP